MSSDIGVRNRGPQASSESQNVQEERILKNKPKASKLRQQQLPAWQPILTASTVIPVVFCVGIVFIPIGIVLFIASDGVDEVRVDYTEKCNPPSPGLPRICNLDFNIEKDMEGPVYFYYYLENYFQNHRRYVKSRNDQQYLGNLQSTDECAPFDKVNDKPIVPCGAIANSMFNDTFELFHNNLPVPFTTKDVLWKVDENKKFKNPEGYNFQTACAVAFANTVKPPNWSKHICEMKDGLKNVDFVVWMRTAALPNFRKLYRILDATDSKFSSGLPRGAYRLVIQDNYPVASFNGRKHFIISTTSWAGGKNPFLGIAYLVVGSLAVILGVIFIVIHVKFGHSVDELSNVNRQ